MSNTTRIANTLARSAMLAAAVALVSACGSQNPGPDTTAEDTANPLDRFLLESAPANAVPIRQAVGSAEVGAEVAVTGQIGGKVEPFSADFALMTVTDSDVMFCTEMEDDHCPTPWDACCEEPGKLKSGRATVQFADRDGHPLAGSLRGLGGLRELDTVTVAGRVARGSTADNLIINASGVFIHPTPRDDSTSTSG